MKKIEIHIFPDKTSDRKTIRVSVLKIVCLVLGILTAAVGFILFDPIGIFRLVLDHQVVRVYQENKFLKNEIRTAESRLELAKTELEKTNTLRDSLFQDKSMQHIRRDSLATVSPLTPSAENIPNLTMRRKNFLKALQNNSQLASSLPLIYPLKDEFTITNHYQSIYDPFTEQFLPHRGIDFAAMKNDTVYAPGAGSISEVREHRGFGLTLKLEHTTHLRTFYAHLQKSLVQSGTKVKRGSPIAIVGNSGRTPGKALHYEIRYDGIAVNPEDYILVPFSEN